MLFYWLREQRPVDVVEFVFEDVLEGRRVVDGRVGAAAVGRRSGVAVVGGEGGEAEPLKNTLL